MRKIYFAFLSLFLCVAFANAASRTATNTNARNDSGNILSRSTTNQKNTVVSRSGTTRTQNTKKDSEIKKTSSRQSVNKTVSARTAVSPLRTTTTARNAVSKRRASRAATSNISTISTKSFNENYNSCRDAYFTCMDQFCATQNDTYHRCVCSSRLTQIQNSEKLLSQTATSLQDFQDLNIDVISKTSNEVKSMLAASDGEPGIKSDNSKSQTTLNNISEILQKSKKQSLSTSGTLDIAGDIKNIWTTTDFIAGTDIANLTGESLYNAVHDQCSQMVRPNCSENDLKMIVSAYGMYIENDCSVLADNIDAKITNANAAIRTTRHQMQDARLENYDTHNSLSINDCIARVRQDVTTSTACGDGYIHCLDFTGKYLNSTTGEPIYSSDFYQMENLLSLDGNILKNSTNTPFITMLDKKRIFAQNSLDLCTDDADVVWDEFLRQSIVEIYQAQHKRIDAVKSECLNVVNECYLNKSDMLQDFSDNSSLISLGHTLELSEDLCNDKLTTCSNLYGGGPEGLSILVATMKNITDQTIAQTCPDLLTTFAQNICAVSSTDSVHSYPYGCRVYAPGESMYAHNAICNTTLVNPFSRSDILVNNTVPITQYICPNATIRYKRCEFNYYLYNMASGDAENNYYSRNNANECHACPAGYICTGGTLAPQSINQNLYESCGVYYIGSLYQQLVRYALQNCTRPSDNSDILPESILADVNMVMNTVREKLVSELSSECDSYNGTWVDIPWTDDNFDGKHDLTGDTLLKQFYTVTGTNKLWGYCKP